MLHIVVCYNCSWLSFFSATHVHNTKPQTSGTLRWFWRCKESTIPCSYTSQSMREIQCCSKLQAAKAHRRLSKAVAKYKWTGVPGISLVVSTDWHAMSTSSSKAFSWEAKNAQCWTRLTNLLALLWPWESTEQQRWVPHGLSWYRLYSLRQMVKTVGFIQQIPRHLLVRSMECPQSGPRRKTFTATGTCSWDLSVIS